MLSDKTTAKISKKWNNNIYMQEKNKQTKKLVATKRYRHITRREPSIFSRNKLPTYNLLQASSYLYRYVNQI